LKPSERAAGAPAGTHSKKNIAVLFLPELFFGKKVKKRANSRLKVLEDERNRKIFKKGVRTAKSGGFQQGSGPHNPQNR